MNALILAHLIVADYERRSTYAKVYYAKNKLGMLASMKRWVTDNRARSRSIKAAWAKRNPEKQLACARSYRRRRVLVDPAFKMARALRARFIKVLRSRGVYGRRCSFKGVDVGAACQHIESKFLPGMSWANHGTAWHVDHIIPCASFDLTDEAQLNQCFHPSNLQPLWAADNQRKGAKLPHELAA